jgi:hypothetical protein
VVSGFRIELSYNSMNPSPNHVDEIKIKHEKKFLNFSEKVLN